MFALPRVKPIEKHALGIWLYQLTQLIIKFKRVLHQRKTRHKLIHRAEKTSSAEVRLLIHDEGPLKEEASA
jgi:hypothetical protein